MSEPHATAPAHAQHGQILGLDPERLQALLTPQPRKTVTFVAPPSAAAPTTHTCAGAGCTHHQPAEAATAVPVVEQKPIIKPVAADVTQVAPANTVEAPVQQQGRAAANDAHIQRAG